MMSVRWVFDPAPPSGKRTGGNAAEYSFEGRIDVLVREVVQNSLDAGVDHPVRVTFRLIDVDGDALDAFRDAMDWSSLEDNLRAINERRGGRGIKQALEDIETTDRLRLLVIEDRGTRGIEGDERRHDDDERNSFCALVRDELYSDKTAEDALGSFGLGKSVLWAYSSLKTVLFSSIPRTPPSGHSGLRFIGRTSLPYHVTVDDGECSGDGWLGIARDPTSPTRRAESVWGMEASRIADACLAPRTTDDFGLSAVVIGFAEPGQEDRPAEEIVQTIVDSSLESFWPAIVRKRLSISVRREYGGEVVEERAADPLDHDGYRPAAELLRAFDDGRLVEKNTLAAGESAVRPVPIEVPLRHLAPEHTDFQGRVAVLVRLLTDDDEMDAIRDRIFRFRGIGMVVRADRKARLSIAARPYVAAVVAGKAYGSSEADERIERFLRAAEPPAHDEWTHNTRTIKQEYQERGCRAKLDRFEQAILTAIRELVSQPEARGGQLPDSVLRHLRFGERGGGGNPRFLAVTRTRALADGDAWRFEARCRRVRANQNPWHLKVHLKYAVDGGGGDDVHAIAGVEAEGAVRTEIRTGVGFIEFPATVDTSRIKGWTDRSKLPAIGTRSAVRLRIDGMDGGIPDA